MGVMDEAELSLRRSQMGQSVQPWVLASGSQAVGGLGTGHWLMLSGAPSPDVNVALVYDGDPETLANTRHRVETAGYPTLFMLAGPSKATELGSGWQHAGAMPFMLSSLTSEHLHFDTRVRQADAGDFDTVGEIMAEAYGMTREVADVVPNVLRVDQDAIRIWLLFDNGQPVSTVLTAIVDDAVCVWCMGTPARFGRQGYGRSLLADVLLRAKGEGASIGLLGATAAGKPLYEATGWSTLEEWQLFLNAESVQFSH
jgi:Acetyltransferase (GNAT) domain